MANTIFNIILYAAALGFLIFSFVRDRKKTRLALLRLAISIPGIMIIAYAIYFLIPDKDKTDIQKKLQGIGS